MTLRVYALTSSRPGLVLRHAADRPWNELTETFRTAPPTGRRSVASGPLRRHRWKTIDVSSLTTGAPRVSLALLPAGPAEATVASRESGATSPQLSVDAPMPAPKPASPLPTPAKPQLTPPPPVTQIGASPSVPTPSLATPCGLTATPPAWQHVVWIVMENKDLGQVIGAPTAPYLNGLAARCGLATGVLAIAHPSLPNYIALASGATQGVTTVLPPAHSLAAPNIFSQLNAGWRTLAESMPTPCNATDGLLYTAEHNPAVLFSDDSAACPQQSVPLGPVPDLSARFTLVLPNTCNSMEKCPVATGDTWLSKIVPQMIDSPEYRSGTAAIFVTWDEPSGPLTQAIATIVISPSTPAGTRDATAYTHYSLLRTTEEMLGLPPLAGATTATSMRPAFDL